MKCPVCGEVYFYVFSCCDNCGFNRMKVEFLNDEERRLWLCDTVEPCQSVYGAACESYESLEEEYDELQFQFDVLQEEHDELQEEYDNLREKYEQLLKTYGNNSKTIPINKSGWNYDDLITHPNYAKCSYVNDSSVVEIYNIEGEGTSENYKIKFVVKVLSEKYGCKRVHFDWRLKDPDGVVVLTGSWIRDGLLPGDVTRGEISFHNIGKHWYSLDFIDV